MMLVIRIWEHALRTLESYLDGMTQEQFNERFAVLLLGAGTAIILAMIYLLGIE